MDDCSAAPPTATADTRHCAVVLFYKYFVTSEYPVLDQHGSFYEAKLVTFFKSVCQKYRLKGRILVSSEGVNGTLSAKDMNIMGVFIEEMEQFELIRDCGPPNIDNNGNGDKGATAEQECCLDHPYKEHYLFQNVDWKKSTSDPDRLPEPFPDLKVSIVKEIISSGGGVTVDEISTHGGQHLDPHEFHRVLAQEPNVVLIDVRNTFECEIGHFVNPQTQEAAIDPDIENFSMFDDAFCAKKADALKDKKVLMYCTGGIRCEKASVMLKRRGVQDVNQLNGGIHRYLEEFGDQGFFRGLNFTFDQRVAMSPAECQRKVASLEDDGDKDDDASATTSHDVVGQCFSCGTAFDELSGARICTVCRYPLLVCPSCQETLREYHCRRHIDWKDCYFTFLEVFTRDQLVQQRTDLLALREQLTNRYKRRTLYRQVEKIDGRIRDLDTGAATVEPNAPRRCRTCMEPDWLCDGNCWGFWRVSHNRQPDESAPAILPVQVGDVVEPGNDWNTLRLGSPFTDEGGLRCGKVMEIKSWGSGGKELDCVVVSWDSDSIPSSRRSDRVPQIYRWGAIARNGSRMYDVQKKL